MKHRMNAKQSSDIEASDKRIAAALTVLKGHNRGLNVLADLKRLSNMASGLDSQGMRALVVLVQEFSKGRRQFLGEISAVVLPPKP